MSPAPLDRRYFVVHAQRAALREEPAPCAPLRATVAPWHLIPSPLVTPVRRRQRTRCVSFDRLPCERVQRGWDGKTCVH